MSDRSLLGLWKLRTITNVGLDHCTFDRVLHFVDGAWLYRLDEGHVSKGRYRTDTNTVPAQIDFAVRVAPGRYTPAIFELVGDELRIARAVNQHAGRFVTVLMDLPRPDDFGGGTVVELYDYAGPGPSDWKAQYKRRSRAQLEEIGRDDYDARASGDASDNLAPGSAPGG